MLHYILFRDAVVKKKVTSACCFRRLAYETRPLGMVVGVWRYALLLFPGVNLIIWVTWLV